jgi:hypothetical protein
MNYLKLYEEFIQSEIEVQDDVELSDKTIDDVLSSDFFSDIEDESEELLSQDKDGVYNIKNWKYY